MTGFGLAWMRPEWLWGYLLLVAALFFWFRRRPGRGAWESVVDPELKPYVIEARAHSASALPLLVSGAWALSLLLLAGQVWQQREVPVFAAEQAEIILFDLSASMHTDDLVPDRLTRARFKLIDLLRRSEGRLTGLIAFAERPYVISPLTDDARTIEAFVPSLEPGILPAQGSRPDLAIERAVRLFEQASVTRGHVILITDAVPDQRDREAASLARSAGYRLSVLAVGTATGAPLRDNEGQFVKFRDGSIVVPRIDVDAVSALAADGGGVAVQISTTSNDLDEIDTVRRTAALTAAAADAAAAQRIYWIEYAPWFLWILVAMLLPLFRRGVVL